LGNDEIYCKNKTYNEHLNTQESENDILDEYKISKSEKVCKKIKKDCIKGKLIDIIGMYGTKQKHTEL